MLKKKMPPESAPGRYDYREVALEIQAGIARGGRGTQARIAMVLRKDKANLSRAIRNVGGDRLTSEEIGVIAEVLRAPTGWPWVPWELGQVFDRMLKGIKKS